MATNTSNTYLMQSTDGKAYTKLIDIINYPDMGSAPDKIDVTTLSDTQKVNILGIDGAADSMDFDILYDPESFAKLKALEKKTLHLALWLGSNASGAPDGNLGKFSFDGMISVYLASGDVNAARKAKLSVTASTKIAFAQGA